MALRRTKNPEGRMALADHLRELRRRVLISVGAILAAAVFGWLAYATVIDRLIEPLTDIAARSGRLVTINMAGLTDALAIQLTVSLFIGLVIASPVWLMQLWGFIVPGLTKKEKRVARLFTFFATPLFLAGCALAYLMLPKAVEVLLGFTPADAANLQDGAAYLAFVLKFIVAFGCAFLLPVFLIALNLIGLLSARRMLGAWRPAILLIFVFAAIMTPTPDAYTMFALAGPMIALYFLSVGVAFLVDRRKEKERPDWLDVPDDQPSAL